MKGKIKRIGAFVIVIVFLFSFSTACTPEKNGDKISNSTQKTSSSTQKTSDNTKESNDTGKEGTNETQIGIPSSPPVKIKFMCSQTWAGSEYGYETGLPRIKELEKRTGVEIEWEVYPKEDFYPVFRTRVAAAVDLPDTFEPIGVDDMNKWADEGIFIPLDDLIEKYAPNIKKRYTVDYPGMYDLIRSGKDGKIYHLRHMHFFEGEDIEVIMYREDWLNKVGFKKPPETTDEFYNFLKACQDKDVNGNGLKDEVLSSEGSYRLFLGFSSAFGVPLYSPWVTDGWQEENGKVYYPWITPEAKEMYTYFNRLYKENLLWNDTPGIGSANLREYYDELFANNAVSAMCHFPKNANDFHEGVKGIEGALYNILMPLIGPQGHGKVIYKTPYFPYNSATVITRDSKNPDAVMRFLDYCMSEEGYLLLRHGEEGVHWERNNKGLVVKTQEWEEITKNDPNASNKYGTVGCFPVWNDESFEQYSVKWKRPELKGIVTEILKMPSKSKFIPALANPTEEEQNILNLHQAEITGYMWSTVNAFIRGDEPLSKWDDFVKRVNDLGLSKIQKIQQDRYNRAMNKR